MCTKMWLESFDAHRIEEHRLARVAQRAQMRLTPLSWIQRSRSVLGIDQRCAEKLRVNVYYFADSVAVLCSASNKEWTCLLVLVVGFLSSQ